MTSYTSLLVCVISGSGVRQKCRLQKLVKISLFVQMAKLFRRSYFNKVQFQIQKYVILGDGHFKRRKDLLAATARWWVWVCEKIDSSGGQATRKLAVRWVNLGRLPFVRTDRPD